MKMLLFLTFFLTLLFASDIHSKEYENMTTEELIAEVMKADKKIEEEKDKGKSLDRLEKTVDELAQKLKIEE